MPKKKIDHDKMSYEEILLKYTPQFCIGITFVPYGYQLNVFKDGKKISGRCRDFGSNHKIDELVLEFSEKFDKMMEDFNKNK